MRPMLSEAVESLADLRYPLYGSPKLDGIRAFVYEGKLMSRNFKPIPNEAVQLQFRELPHGYDGELIVGDPRAKDCFNRTTSQIMSRDGGIADVRFFVFDNFAYKSRFTDRIMSVDKKYRITHFRLDSPDVVVRYEFMQLKEGYEGIILRDPNALYKHGRSTIREQGMLKLKRFKDDEAEVIRVEELMHNDNPAKIDAQGYTDRSSHQANLKPMGVLGALVVNWKGHELRIGTGFTQAQRVALWEDPPIGKIAKFKYLEAGMKDLPRHPVWLGFRDWRDL